MLGSHNTFTYRRAQRWWMRLLRPIARCQRRDLARQGEGQCGLVDVRLRLHQGEVWVSHGPVRYITFADMEREVLSHARRLGCIVTVRVLLEGTWTTSALVMLERHMKQQRGVRYVCGRERKAWRKVLDIPDVEVNQQGVASMSSQWWGKLWPWLWWRLKRGELESREPKEESEILMYDFL